MFVVGRSPNRLEGLIVVGKASYLNEVIDLAGGTNIFRDAVAGYPAGRISRIGYTDGTTVPGAGGGFAPAGLPYSTTSPGGEPGNSPADEARARFGGTLPPTLDISLAGGHASVVGGSLSGPVRT